MCYSARIYADFRKFEREFGAILNFEHFWKLFWEKQEDGGWQKLPRAMRQAFRTCRNDDERELADLVTNGDRKVSSSIETELFQQKTRLTEAERALAIKSTKKAENDKRVATDKTTRAQRNLADFQRTDFAGSRLAHFPWLLRTGIGGSGR